MKTNKKYPDTDEGWVQMIRDVPFPVSEGMKVQTGNLRDYKRILTKTAYAKLEVVVKAHNRKGSYKDGFDVLRGSDIYDIVKRLRLLKGGRK